MLPFLYKSALFFALNLAKTPVKHSRLHIISIYCEITTFPCQSMFIFTVNKAMSL